MIEIKIPNVVGGVLNTQFGNGNLGGDFRNSVSFPLSWSNVKGAKSYAVTLIDYESTNTLGTIFVHWVAANIQTNKLKWDESFAKKDKLFQFENSVTDKASAYMLQSFYQSHPNGVYFGPFPPDCDHNYRLEVFALDINDILENSPFDPKQPLFYDQFLELIKNHVIDWGVTSFLYRTRSKVEEGRIIPLEITENQLNLPLSEEQSKFFVSFDKINFYSNALQARSNNYHLLDIKYLGKEASSLIYGAQNFDLEIYSESQNIKEYVILVTSFAETSSLGVGLVCWVKVGIKKTNNSYKTIVLAGNNPFEKSNDLVEIQNTFAGPSAENIASIIGKNVTDFDLINHSYGLLFLPGLTNGQGNYSLEIFGINQEIDWTNIEKTKGQKLNATDVLQTIKGKIVAYNRTFFKLV